MAEWIENYTKYHHGRILTDFDEVIPTLDAMLSLRDMAHGIDQYRLKEFLGYIRKRALSPDVVDYNAIQDFLIKYFDIEDVRLLARDYIGLKIENLVGPNARKLDHIETLFQYCEEQDLMEKLVVGCTEMRPGVIKEISNIMQ